MTTYEAIIDELKVRCTDAGANSVFYHSIFVMNTHRDHEYPVMILSPISSRLVNNAQQFRFNLWWIGIEHHDRQNIAQLQGIGIEALYNVINGGSDDSDIWDITFGSISVFSDRFADICAGAMCEVLVTVAASDCIVPIQIPDEDPDIIWPNCPPNDDGVYIISEVDGYNLITELMEFPIIRQYNISPNNFIRHGKR